MKIVIDADAQPCRRDIVKLAASHGIKAVSVMSFAHHTEREEGEEIINVESEPQAADIKIMNIAQPGDIAITQDSALAYVLQGKGVITINSRGYLLDSDTARGAMEAASKAKKSRRKKTGKIRIKGPDAFTDEDKKRLLSAVEKAITGSKI